MSTVKCDSTLTGGSKESAFRKLKAVPKSKVIVEILFELYI